MQPVDAVCFDLDGTLCVPEWTDHEFNDEVFERAGVDPIFSPSDLRAVDPEDVRRESRGRGDSDAGGITGFYKNLYRAAVRDSDADVEPGSPLVEELGEIAGDLYDPAAVTFREGAEETLEYVRERYAVGLVTNGTRATQGRKLETLGLTETFDATVFCDPDLGIAAKPAVEPFEMVLSDLETSAQRTVHVGDSHGEDVRGAHEAGLRSVWAPVNRPHEEIPSDPRPEPTYRVASLADLRTIL